MIILVIKMVLGAIVVGTLALGIKKVVSIVKSKLSKSSSTTPPTTPTAPTA